MAKRPHTTSPNSQDSRYLWHWLNPISCHWGFVYQIHIKNASNELALGDFTLDLKHGSGFLRPGMDSQADVFLSTVTVGASRVLWSRIYDLLWGLTSNPAMLFEGRFFWSWDGCCVADYVQLVIIILIISAYAWCCFPFTPIFVRFVAQTWLTNIPTTKTYKNQVRLPGGF